MNQALRRMEQLKNAPTQEAVDAFVEEAIRITQSKIGYYALLNFSEEQLTMLGWSKSAMEACRMVAKPIVYKITDTGLWGDCVRYRKPCITNDYATAKTPNKKGYPGGHIEVVHHLNVPIWEGEKIRGILGVGNKPMRYMDSDANTLQDFANQGWPFLRTAMKL